MGDKEDLLCCFIQDAPPCEDVTGNAHKRDLDDGLRGQRCMSMNELDD